MRFISIFPYGSAQCRSVSGRPLATTFGGALFAVTSSTPPNAAPRVQHLERREWSPDPDRLRLRKSGNYLADRK
ncbi:hypothetical protein [uncultured Sphingopyxis sp.]|jgi:hypothetical protein|uniref:hypothetical protein n=1 Tax=uncultured Sphingopyxis sp. TaxID=310581 RepID=UPI000786871A|nr:hypothetical protein [uncultured Sphingopyxis sp.]